jgi:hypothetical protein
MADPVSWLLIEPGWQVDAADAQEVGRIEEVLGDSTTDIFDGLSISGGMFEHPKYVAAEQIALIVDGRVRLSLTKAQIDQLGEFKEPPEQVELAAEPSSRLSPVEGALAPPAEDTKRVGLVRRVLEWLGVAGRR